MWRLRYLRMSDAVSIICDEEGNLVFRLNFVLRVVASCSGYRDCFCREGRASCGGEGVWEIR